MGNNFTTRFQARFAVVYFVFFITVAGIGQSSVDQAIEYLQANEPEKAQNLLVEEVKEAPSALAYANLASAELALRNQGEASFAFEMSRALGGFSDAEAFRQNLQQGLPAELRSLSDSPIRKVLQPILRIAPENAFTGISVFSGFVACLIALALMFKTGFSNQSWPKLALVGLLTLCVTSLVLAKARSNYRNPSSGVVMKSTQLYEAPSELSARIRSLPEGAVVSVGELLNGTYNVKLPTGDDGWVPETDIRMVELSKP